MHSTSDLVDSGIDPDPESDGAAWCSHCERRTGYRSARVEFLGNPVVVSCFCVECGERTYPQATDLKSARRLRSKGRWRRIGAASSIALILLLPLVAAGGVLYLLWRLF